MRRRCLLALLGLVAVAEASFASAPTARARPLLRRRVLAVTLYDSEGDERPIPPKKTAPPQVEEQSSNFQQQPSTKQGTSPLEWASVGNERLDFDDGDEDFVQWALANSTASESVLGVEPSMGPTSGGGLLTCEGDECLVVDDDETAVGAATQQSLQVPTLAQCFAFALPALGIYVAPSLLSLIDAAIVGQANSVHLAALGPASTISDSAPNFLLFLSIAATNLVARSMAFGDKRAAGRTARGALRMAAYAGAGLGALVYACATPLSALYCGSSTSAAAALVPLSASYIRIRALALPAAVMGSVAQAVCIGSKDSKSPLLAVASSAIFNFAGDLLLVCGLGFGIVGAAWATTGAQYVAAILLLRVLSRRGLLPSARELRSDDDDAAAAAAAANNGDDDASAGATAKQPAAVKAAATGGTKREVAKSILSFGPLVLVMTIKNIIHNTAAATSASLGGAQAAAHTALFATAMLCFMIGDVGSSLAPAFLPGFTQKRKEPPPQPHWPPMQQQQKKEGVGGLRRRLPRPGHGLELDMDAAWPTIAQLLRSTLCLSTCVVAISTLILTVGTAAFTGDPSVALEIRRTVPLIATTLTLHGTAVSLEGLLLAKKDFTTLCTAYSLVGAAFVGMQFLTRRLGLGLHGVWSAYIMFQVGRIAIFSWRGGLLKLAADHVREAWRRRARERREAKGLTLAAR